MIFIASLHTKKNYQSVFCLKRSIFTFLLSLNKILFLDSFLPFFFLSSPFFLLICLCSSAPSYGTELRVACGNLAETLFHFKAVNFRSLVLNLEIASFRSYSRFFTESVIYLPCIEVFSSKFSISSSMSSSVDISRGTLTVNMECSIKLLVIVLNSSFSPGTVILHVEYSLLYLT